MNNLLVTGGAGFIGSNFIHYMLKKDPDVSIVNLDALTYAGNIDNLNNLPDQSRHTFVHGDICDTKEVHGIMQGYHVDTIVHFAAETHVDRSIHDPEVFLRTNVMGTYTLLEQARRYGARFHHVSTDEVYGALRPQEASWTEESPYAPHSPYSASKAASDHLVRAYGHTYGIEYTITNCSNNYGPRQHPEKLIPLTITNALKGKEIPVYGDGLQIRDWVYVEDHCKAIWLVLKGGVIGETYNIGGDNQPTNITIVRTICSILDGLIPRKGSYKDLICCVEDRLGHDRRYAVDSTKIQKELGWRPTKALDSGLEETVKWYMGRADR